MASTEKDGACVWRRAEEGGRDGAEDGGPCVAWAVQAVVEVCMPVDVCVSACVCMSVCVCTRGSRRLVNGTNGRGGPGKREQACCYRGRTASLRRGLLHLGSCHTHTHTLCQTLVSPHPPAPKHTVCCHAAPEAKGRSSQNFSFANEVGRGWAEENRTAFICLICVFARTHTHTQIFVCACICVWWVATMCVIYEVQRNRGTIKRVRCGESEDKDKEGPVWGSVTLTPRIHLPQSANINITSLHFTCVSFFLLITHSCFFTDFFKNGFLFFT